jgi:hypothetical protein
MKSAMTIGKKFALNAALERVEALAKKRGESVTDAIRSQISAKADALWKKWRSSDLALFDWNIG